MTKLRISLLTGILAIATSVVAQNKMTPEQYIGTYKDFAIIEMHRSGVPASITLAQGMLESSYGNSRLATKGNNHFGIKCKGDWTGNTIYADDDAPNECFRAYNSALESYRDHSDFLRANWRYHDLFDLQVTDYEGWAKGLRKAGYATNKAYHSIIINLVEKYKLYEYDVAPMPGDQIILYTSHQVPMVEAQKDETLEAIASRNDLTVNQIYKYNDLKKGSSIAEGDVVYLKPKRRRGTEKAHVVQEGESMYQISQMYGIKLKQLYRRNRLEMGEEVAAGQTVYMRGKLDKDDSLDVVSAEEKKVEAQKFINPHALQIEKAPPIVKEVIKKPAYHVVQTGENIYRIAEKYHVFEEDLIRWNTGLNPLALSLGQKVYLSEESAQAAGAMNAKPPVKPDIQVEEVETEKAVAEIESASKYHEVQKGETVYRICSRYGITPEQLTSWNKLNGTNIYAGQKLKISE